MFSYLFINDIGMVLLRLLTQRLVKELYRCKYKETVNLSIDIEPQTYDMCEM